MPVIVKETWQTLDRVTEGNWGALLNGFWPLRRIRIGAMMRTSYCATSSIVSYSSTLRARYGRALDTRGDGNDVRPSQPSLPILI